MINFILDLFFLRSFVILNKYVDFLELRFNQNLIMMSISLINFFGKKIKIFKKKKRTKIYACLRFMNFENRFKILNITYGHRQNSQIKMIKSQDFFQNLYASNFRIHSVFITMLQKLSCSRIYQPSAWMQAKSKKINS